MPADAAEIVRLAERLEQISTDAMRAACDDEWYSAISACTRGFDEIADHLRARAAQHDHEVG